MALFDLKSLNAAFDELQQERASPVSQSSTHLKQR